MITVAQYRRFAQECRQMAARMTNENDKHALELMAVGWDKAADEREAAIKGNKPLVEPTS